MSLLPGIFLESFVRVWVDCDSIREIAEVLQWHPRRVKRLGLHLWAHGVDLPLRPY